MDGTIQMFFTFFLWTFYVPWTEINCGVAVTGSNSFITAYRIPGEGPPKPIYEWIFGCLGFFLTLLTGISICSFFVSYDFLDPNILKRRFRVNQVAQLCLRTLYIFLYYLNFTNVFYIKHMLGHGLTFVIIYDWIKYQPFKNKSINLFYGLCFITQEWSFILYSLFEISAGSSIVSESSLFYSWLSIIPFIYGFCNVYQNQFQEKLLTLMPFEDSDYLDFVDFYLEELWIFAENDEISQVDKLKLFAVLTNHTKQCTLKGCLVSKGGSLQNFKDDRNQVDQNVITKIINTFFIQFLDQIKNQKRITFIRQDLQEHIYLKYCCFLANKQNNPIKAYYEIKKLIRDSVMVDKKSVQTSMLCKSILKIISEEQQIRINQKFKRNEITKKIYKYNDGFEYIAQYQNKQVETLTEITKQKILFWSDLCKGYTHMDKLWNDVFIKVQKMISLKAQFESFENQLNQNQNYKDNIIIVKLQGIYINLMMNFDQQLQKSEAKLFQCIKQDEVQLKNTISSSTILEGNTILITGSLLLNEGGIIFPVSERASSFFGYKTSLEFQENIQNIDQIMTGGIGEKHIEFIKYFIINGQSTQIEKQRHIQYVDKSGFMQQGQIFYSFNFQVPLDFCINAIMTNIQPLNYQMVYDTNGKMDNLQKPFYNQYICQSILGKGQELETQKMHSNYENIIEIQEFLKAGLYFPILTPQILNYFGQNNLKTIFNDKTYILVPKNLYSFFQLLNNFLSSCENIASNTNTDRQSKQSKSQNKNKSSNKSSLQQAQSSKNMTGSNMNLVKEITQLQLIQDITQLLNNHKIDLKTERHRIYLFQFLQPYLKIDCIQDHFEIYIGNVNMRYQQYYQQDTPQYFEQYILQISEISQINIEQYKALKNNESFDIDDIIGQYKKNQQIFNIIDKSLKEEEIEQQKESEQVETQSIKDNELVQDLKENQFLLDVIDESQQQKSLFDEQSQESGYKKKKISNLDINKNQEDSIMELDADSILQDSQTDIKPAQSQEVFQDQDKDLNNTRTSHNKNYSQQNIDFQFESVQENEKINNKENQQTKKAINPNNYGINLIEDILNNKKQIKLTKNIVSISYLQIVFFIVINLGYIFIFQSQLNGLQTNFTNISQIDGGLYSYSQCLYGQMFGILATKQSSSNSIFPQKSIINFPQQSDINNLQFIIKFMNNFSHQWLQTTLNQQAFFKNQILNMDINFYEIKQDWSLVQDQRNLFQIFNYQEQRLFMDQVNYSNNVTDITAYQQYLSTQLNFDLISSGILNFNNEFNQSIQNNKNSFMSLYLVITIIGFIIGLLLQFLNMPFVNLFINYIERSLMLMARISEQEAKNEEFFFQSFLKQLQRTNQSYLLKSNFNESEEKQNSKSKNEEKDKKKNNNSNSYISNKIQFPKISRVNNFGLNFITLGLVGAYFSVFFIIVSSIQSKMDYIVSLNEQQKQWKYDSMMVQLLPVIILSRKFTNSLNYDLKQSQNQIDQFNLSLANLRNSQNAFQIFTNSLMPDTYRNQINQILTTNLNSDDPTQFITLDQSSDPVVQAYITQKLQTINQRQFQAGMMGYLGEMINRLQIILPFITNAIPVERDQILILYSDPDNVNSLMLEYYINNQLSIKLTSIISQGITQIMNDIYNSLYQVCLYGGVICVILLTIIIIIFYQKLQKQIYCARFVLILLPIQKLLEDATLHLLKKLENI